MDHTRIKLNEYAPLNKNVPIPLYYQLKQYMISQIKSEKWPAGWRIPSEQQLCQNFSISRPTARQAIQEMVSEGFLARDQRCVTVSKVKMIGDFFYSIQSFDAEMSAKHLHPSTKVLALDIRHCCEATEFLDSEDEFVYLERLRFANVEPVVWVKTFLPYSTVPGLMSVDFEQVSLYETLEEQYQIRISRVDRIFEATLACEQESGILGVKKGAPICFVKTTAYSQYGTPIEFSVASYLGDKSKFMTTLKR